MMGTKRDARHQIVTPPSNIAQWKRAATVSATSLLVGPVEGAADLTF